MSKPKQPESAPRKDPRPLCYLWSVDPDTGEVVLEDEEGDGKANYPTHDTMAEHITHPERVDGYAIAIEGGWRIFTDDVEEPDPYILEHIRRALARLHPPPPLPHVVPHRDPHGKLL